MKRVGFIFLALLFYNDWVSAAPSKVKQQRRDTQHHLYVVPHINLGTLYDKDGTQISGLLSGQFLVNIHYQFSSKIAVTLMGHHWLRHDEEQNPKVRAFGFDLVTKYRLYSFKTQLLSKPLHIYGQGGGFYASLAGQEAPPKGLGMIGGAGVYYTVSRFLLDISYKRLLPVVHHEISGANLLTVGFGVKIF